MLLINLYFRSFPFLDYRIPTMFLADSLGFVVAIAIIIWEARRLKLNYWVILMIYMLFAISSSILGRILFILSNIYLHSNLASQAKLWGFYPVRKINFGFVLSGPTAVYLGVYIFKIKKQFFKYLDATMPGLVFFTFFYRLGNVSAYYHPGKITTMPWGVYNLGQIRHEPSLYEAISAAILFLIVVLVRKKIITPGILSFFILAWLSLSRVIIDFFRADDLPNSNFHFGNGLTLNQAAYGVLFLLCLAGIIFLRRKQRKKMINLEIQNSQPFKN